MSNSTDAAALTEVPSLSRQIEEQFASLVRLIAIVEPRAWMNLDITMPQFKVMLFLWHAQRARVGVLA